MDKNKDKADHILRVRITFPDRKSLPKIAHLGPLDWGGRGPRLQADGRMTGEVYITTKMLTAIKKLKNCKAEVIEDATEVGKSRQQEVAKGDRFEKGRKIPQGLGKKG